jgi:hypothetical protein
MIKKFFIVAVLFSLTQLIVSCGKALPPEWKELEGVWQNEEVYMQISADGSFQYKRQSQGQNVEINTWIKEYSDKGFTVSTVVSTTDFVVNRKPFKDESGNSMMEVDGRILVKKDSW